MMLGKRGRPPMKRTTSMTEFTLDFNGGADSVYNQPLDPLNPFNGGGLDQQYSTSASASASAVFSRPPRLKSADFVEPAHFLRVCFLCKRRLIPGRDIYMYRGDSAFCSLECRDQQMTQDERKEKCSLASKKEGETTSAAAGPQGSGTGETVAAV